MSGKYFGVLELPSCIQTVKKFKKKIKEKKEKKIFNCFKKRKQSREEARPLQQFIDPSKCSYPGLSGLQSI